jgi:SpoIID/LytB domain protein
VVVIRRIIACVAAAVSIAAGVADGPVAAERTTTADVTVTLTGRGNGHGIGLSQWGAYGYAVDHGWTAAQILDHYYGGTVAATADPTTMTVRLTALDEQQTAVVHDKGALVVTGIAGGPWSSVLAREVAPSTYSVWARSDSRVCPAASDSALAGWTQIGAGMTSVTIAPATDTSASSDYGDLLAVCEPSGKVRSYRGSVRATNGSAGENRTVNHVPVEQYLRPVVATEMSASWASRGGGRGAQALQAQAVAARSYAHAENKWSYAKTCDNVCQAYFGAAWRSSTTGSFMRIEQTATDAAVAATVGMVRRVGSAGGAVAYAMFSASSGGRTAPSTHGFTVVDDVGDATALNPHRSWSTTLTGAAIAAAWPAIGAFTGLAVEARAGGGEWGGRVASISIVGSKGSVKVTGDAFRTAMGLKSTWFTVATNGAGTGAGAAAPATPPAPTAAPTTGCGGRVPPAVAGSGAATAVAARLQAISPVRLVDTRDGVGTSVGALGRGCTIVVKPAVTSGTTAVAINVTTVDSDGDGFVTAYPCGIERPLTATVQPLTGQVVGGAALVPLSAAGTFCVYANVTTHVVIDLFGAFAPSGRGRFEPIAPQRKYDSRPTATRLPAGSVVRVNVRTSAAPTPDAVALTVHAIDAAAGGFVTAWPCDTPKPFVSAANVAAGASVTNHAEVAVGASGEVCFFLSAAMHLVVDLSGWYGAAGSTDLHAVTPFRLADTRIGKGWSGPFARFAGRTIRVAGAGGVPGAGTLRAVAGQITAVGATGAGYLTVHPCQPKAPDLSMLRYPATRNVAVLVTGATDSSGRWCLVTNAATHLVVDVTGWFG